MCLIRIPWSLMSLNKENIYIYIYCCLNSLWLSKVYVTQSFKNNVIDIGYFTKKYTNYWYSEWLLINENVILMMGLDENQ